MADSKHDRISKKLAAQNGVEYNKGEGPDVKAEDRVIEVVTHESDLYSSLRQVSRFKKPRYIAAPRELQKKARELTQGTGIGVMGTTGTIIKRSRKK